jgi:hypothetical protein
MLETDLKQPMLRMDQPRGVKRDQPKPKPQPKPKDTFNLAICCDPAALADKPPASVRQVVHDFGLVLLCALFLEKGQSAELIEHFWTTGNGNAWDAERRAMIKEFIAVYRVRLPLARLRSDESPQAIALDTLSELSRRFGPYSQALFSMLVVSIRQGRCLTIVSTKGSACEPRPRGTSRHIPDHRR